MRPLYRVGILGAGMMGRTHAWAWSSLPYFFDGLPYRCDTAGVCTSRPETAQAARDALLFWRAFDNAEEMIADRDIDIIDIATPNNLHVDAILAAAAAGKPIYCDKPLSGNLAEARRITQAGLDPASLGQMVFHNRFFPATMRARQMVEAGDLGEIICFRGSYLHSGNVVPGKPIAWKDTKAAAAGVLYDLGAHIVDLVTWICGQGVAEVYTRQRILNPLRPSKADPGRMVAQDADDYSLMSLQLTGGATGTIEASKIATGAQDELGFEIHGTRGAIRFHLMEPNWLEYFDISDPEAPLGGTSGYKRIHCVRRYEAPAGFPGPKAPIGWMRGHLQCLFNFIDSVHHGRAFEPSLARGIEIEEILDAAQRSADTGLPVRP